MRDVRSHLNRCASCCVLATELRVGIKALILIHVSELDRGQRQICLLRLVFIASISDSWAILIFFHLLHLLMVDLRLDELPEAVVVFKHLLLMQ